MANKRSKLVLGLFLVSAVVVLALSLYTGLTLNSLVDSLEHSRSERVLAEAQAASLVVSADELEAIQDADSISSEQGASLERRLSAFSALHNLSDITFIRQLPSGELQYIIGSSLNTGTYDISAAPFDSNEMITQAFSGSIVVKDLRDSGADSTGLMAFSPVYDANGSVMAVAAVGVDDAGVLQADSRIRDLTTILLVCIALVILAACANVLLQVRKEHELEESVNVQKLMIRLSQVLSSEQPFDERVNETLGILGSYLGAFRAYIVNVSDLNVTNSLRQHWNSDHSNLEGGDGKNDAVAIYTLMRDTFISDAANKQSAVSCASIEQSLSGRYSILQQTKTRAFIWLPLIVQNEIWGVLALDFSKAQKQFADKDIQLVESAACDLVGAITRELYSEQREQALNHAVHASEAKSQFLSNMSHEMRTPMNAIIGMTTIALGSSEESRKDYCLEHIKDASAHLLDIINDVLDMSSIQAGELSLKLAPFSVQQTIDGSVSDHIHKINEHNLNFSIEMDEGIPPVLIGDKQRLAKVVSNLLSNAIKFTHNDGSIALRVKHLGAGPSGHRLYFEIEDSGIGMDPATRDSLFGSFEQAESGANRKYGGTGLGLAISRRLVELMNGEMGVESSLGEGSTFYFTVTLEEDPTATPDNPQEEQQETADLDAGKNWSDLPNTSPLKAKGSQDHPGESGTLTATAQTDILSRSSQSSEISPQKHVVSPEESHSEVALGIPDLSDYRILLAEDIEINREVVLALLAESGVVIDITTNGVEVLEAVKDNPGKYDLVFMDLQMPQMDGLEATRRIRALPHPELADLPIIAMTANVFQEDIDACRDAGMNDHIGKPISLEDIYRVLEIFLPKKP